MPLRDIFLHADNSADFKPRLEAAVDLASTHRAHLTAVYVPELPKERSRARRAAHPAMLLVSPAAASRPRAVDLRAANAYERVRETSERVKDLFMRQAERAGVPCQWVYEEAAELTDALSLHARFCDVLVITQPAEKDHSRELVTLGLPILMVPKKAAGAGIGRRIMIAWDRSPVALRAVNNARPFLREAAEVKVLSVDLEPIYRGATSGSGIIEHLARHDIKAARLRMTSRDSRLSDVILSTARKENIDLIVMGAFGKHGLRERILGGVTSHVITETTVPLLLSH